MKALPFCQLLPVAHFNDAHSPCKVFGSSEPVDAFVDMAWQFMGDYMSDCCLGYFIKQRDWSATGSKPRRWFAVAVAEMFNLYHWSLFCINLA